METMFIAENVGHKKRRGKYTKINNGFTGTALPLFVTLRGKFDWISLVGEAAQHILSLTPHQTWVGTTIRTLSHPASIGSLNDNRDGASETFE